MANLGEISVETNLEASNTDSNINNDKIEKNDEMTKTESNEKKRLNKTMKKKLRYQKKLEFYKLKKQQKKINKKEEALKRKLAVNNEKSNETNQTISDETKKNYLNEQQPLNKKRKIKRLERANINEKLKDLYENENKDNNNILKICVDCSFCSLMSEKEQSRLAQQIGRSYALNRAAQSPAHITLTNLEKETYFYKELCRVNDGFERYIMKKTDQSIEQLYMSDLNKLCYLSPDSKSILNELDLTKVYVIGGLVDETVTKKVTLGKSSEMKIESYRLPIEEHMKRRSNAGDDDRKYNFNKILAINQVVDILLSYHETHDWKKALSKGVPSRKGFFVEDQ